MSRIALLIPFLMTPAFAQAGEVQSPWMQTLFMIVPMVLIFYFFIIRPQNKRMKEHKSLLESIKPGNEVLLGSGIVGRVKQFGENYVEIEIANNVTVRVQRQSIVALLPNGTMKGEL